MPRFGMRQVRRNWRSPALMTLHPGLSPRLNHICHCQTISSFIRRLAFSLLPEGFFEAFCHEFEQVVGGAELALREGVNVLDGSLELP